MPPTMPKSGPATYRASPENMSYMSVSQIVKHRVCVTLSSFLSSPSFALDATFRLPKMKNDE